jgi:hypothetical protein
MRESVTYMAIIDEGRVEEARKIIRWLGSQRFGPPDETTTTTLTAIEDISRLEEFIKSIMDVKTWQELLAR